MHKGKEGRYVPYRIAPGVPLVDGASPVGPDFLNAGVNVSGKSP